MSAASPLPQLSRLALASLFLGSASILMLIVSGTGYRLNWWHFLTGLQIAEWAVYAAAACSVFSVTALWRLLQNRHKTSAQRGHLMALAGLLLSTPVLFVAVQWEYATRTYPPINDISTDTEDPPGFWEMPNPMDYPGAQVAAQQRAAYPDLQPLALKAPTDRVFQQALQLVQERGWEVVSSKPEEGSIEATATSRLFGFVDEVAIRTTPEGDTTRVDMRSRSRLGKIDRGVNARRIRSYLDDLQARTSALK